MKTKNSMQVLLLGAAVLAASPTLPKPGPVQRHEPPRLDAEIHMQLNEALRVIRQEARQGLNLALPRLHADDPAPAVAAARVAGR